MTISANFKIKQMVASDFNGAEIIDVASNRSYGRRFKLKIGDVESKEYILSDLYQRVRRLSKKETEYTELKSLRNFINRLKESNATAEIAYSKREFGYRFRTWFHRLLNFRSHANKMDKCLIEIAKKIFQTDQYLENVGVLLRDAASKGDFENVKELLGYLGDVNRTNVFGNTPLHIAISQNQTEVAKILIDAKADVNKLNNLGYPPLSIAVASKQLDLVKLLLSNRANCNLAGKDNISPLMLAVLAGKKEIIEELLNQKGIEVAPALYCTIVHGRDDILKLLLDFDSSEINHVDSNRETHLIKAALLGNEKMVELLLQYPNIQVNQKNSKGATALSYAASFGYKGIVERLIKYEKIDLKGSDAFMRAKMNGEKEISELLKAVMQPEDLFLQKEKLKLRILANSTSLKGLSQVQWGDSFNIPLDLEGARPSHVFRKIRKATMEFSLQFPNLIDNSESKYLLELFESILLDSDDATLDRIEKGFPIHLNIGYSGHAVSGMFWGPYFCLCNKGESSRKVVEVFQYDPKKLNLEILKKIRAIKGEDDKAYEALVFEELPVLLDFKPQQKFETLLEILFSQLLNFQTVGNCQWASPETAVFCYFTLSTLLADANGQLDMDAIPSNISCDQLLNINNKFYTWLSFVQAYNLEGYLGTDVLREVNADKMERHKQRRKGIMLDYSVVVSAIKEIIANINKMPNIDKFINSLVQILAKTISITKNESLDDKHIQIAKRILYSVETLTVDEMKAEFESI